MFFKWIWEEIIHKLTRAFSDSDSYKTITESKNWKTTGFTRERFRDWMDIFRPHHTKINAQRRWMLSGYKRL